MDARRQELRRQQLDRQLGSLVASAAIPAPHGGWIKAIREALGLSLDSFAHRLGLASRSTASQIEKAEVNESITVKRLRSAADALGCDLVIAFVPRVPLSETAESQSQEIDLQRYRRVGHSMSLEAQAVAEERIHQISQIPAKRKERE